MEYEIQIHPLNAKGKYYIDQASCGIHGCCANDASNNIRIATEQYNDENFGAYVFKQPETLQEEAQCKEAMDYCPVAAIHDDGEIQNPSQ